MRILFVAAEVEFVTLLRAGKIMYDIRIGSYRSGAKRGKPHDRGSGFRILEGDIRPLYSFHEVVEWIKQNKNFMRS